MHYVRFLKGPTLQPVTNGHTNGKPKQSAGKSSSARAISIHALITLETDLGDSIYYGDLELACSILYDEAPSHVDHVDKNRKRDSLDQNISTRTPAQAIATISATWSSGLRSLAIDVPLPDKSARDQITLTRLRLHVGSKSPAKSAMKDGVLVMPVVISQTVTVMAEKVVSSGEKTQVERPLVLENGRELVIWEDAGISMARHVWDAGVALVVLLDHVAQHDYTSLPQLADLLSTAAQRRKPMQVLELGAGCGLAGVAFGTLVPNSRIFITDVPDAERLILQNIASNTFRTNSHASFHILDWEADLPEPISSDQYDIVLVADCIYNEDSIPALVKTLSALAEQSPDMLVLVATKTRHSSERLFFDLAEKARFKSRAKTHILAPSGSETEDLDEAERIDVYAFTLTAS